MYTHRSRLEALNFGFKKEKDCTIRAAKTKALISCAVTTAQLICGFVFAYANCWFSHAVVHIIQNGLFAIYTSKIRSMLGHSRLVSVFGSKFWF